MQTPYLTSFVGERPHVGERDGIAGTQGTVTLAPRSGRPRTNSEKAERRTYLSLLAAEDVERLERRATLRARGRSIATWVADIGFWLVYGGGMAVVAYIAFCARP